MRLLLASGHEAPVFGGRISRSALSRSCRAISIGVVSVSTSRAASRSTSYWPERISASMILTPVPLVAGGEASDAVPNGLGASVGVQGSLLPEEGEPRWLGGGASLVIDRLSFFEIPDLETSDVHPNGPRAKAQRYSFYQQLVLGEDCVAGVARFAVAWSTPDRFDAVMRQATVLEFAPDDATEDLLVHKAASMSHRLTQDREIISDFRNLPLGTCLQRE
jgi:hypothetical protein